MEERNFDLVSTFDDRSELHTAHKKKMKEIIVYPKETKCMKKSNKKRNS